MNCLPIHFPKQLILPVSLGRHPEFLLENTVKISSVGVPQFLHNGADTFPAVPEQVCGFLQTDAPPEFRQGKAQAALDNAV